MKKKLFLSLICGVLGISLITGCSNTSNTDKGLIEKETISIIDNETGEKYEGVEVIKSYGFVDSTGRTQRLVFLKNNTDLNLRLSITSEMLDNSGNSAEDQNNFIDALGPDKVYITTEDYFNGYKNFNTTVKVSNSDYVSCDNCVSVSEEVTDDGDVTLTYKNIDNKKVFGDIKVIAYKDGKIVDWTIFRLGNLEVGESETEDGYLTNHDKYEVHVYSYK